MLKWSVVPLVITFTAVAFRFDTLAYIVASISVLLIILKLVFGRRGGGQVL